MTMTWRTFLALALVTLCRGQAVLITVAGNGTVGFSGDGGPATAAKISAPIGGLAVDTAGNLFIADIANNRVRKVNASGTISTYAGDGAAGTAGDGGQAISAQLYNELATSWPVEGVAADAAGNVYITDTMDHRVRKVTPAGVISTFAGGGLYSLLGDGGPASKSGIPLPTSVAVDTAGNVYIVDGLRVRKVNTAGIISTVAGNGNPSYSGDGGLATNAAMEPETVAVDSAGNLYIADFVNGCIRKVNTAGIINTIAGVKTNGLPSSGDGGPATQAVLANAHGVAVDNAGNIYVIDSPYLRKIDTTGIITTVGAPYGIGYDGNKVPLTLIGGVQAMTFDSAGNLYLAEYAYVQKLAAEAPAPPVISAVVNGASFLPGIESGSWVTIQGSNLSNTNPGRTWTVSEIVNGNLPTSLDGASVTIDGKPAFVYYISPTQLNVQAPTDSSTGSVQVVVTNNGAVSAPFNAQLQTYAPAFFLYTGTSYAIASHYPDYALVGNPSVIAGTIAAQPGDVLILWATGFGPTDPATPAGIEVVAASSVATQPTITIGGVPVTVLSAVISPGSAGLYQVAIQLPATIPTGAAALRASVGGLQSPQDVLILVAGQ